MLEYFLFAAGFILLLKGADFLVDGASALAKKLGISALAIGLTIVAFGTSMPELVVNIYASIQGQPDVSYGNIVGSNIVNILFILGLAAVLSPLKVKKSTVWKEIPFSFLAVLTFFFLSNKSFWDNGAQNILARTDGIILLLFFALFMYYIIELVKKSKNHTTAIKDYSLRLSILMIIGGLVALNIGGKLVVDGAVFLARQIGFSELFISATIVAIGTSLPELVTSVVAALKKEYDLSVGNIVGSNIFNIFFIMAITSILSPVQVPAAINADFAFLFLATLALFAAMFIGKKHKLERWQGIVFILLYFLYVLFLFWRG